MKSFGILFLICAFTLGAMAQGQVIIKGQFKGYKPNKSRSAVELGYRHFKDKKLSGFNIAKDGSFEMKLVFAEPTIYRFRYGRRSMTIAVDKAGIIESTVDTKGKQVVKGSQATQDCLNYKAKWKELTAKNKANEASRRIFAMLKEKRTAKKGTKDPEKLKAIDRKYTAKYHELYADYQMKRRKTLDELDKYVNDELPMSLAVFPATIDWEENNLAYMKSIVRKFRKAHPNWRVAKYLEDKLQTIISTSTGQVAPDINLKNLQGQTIKLSSLRGKYVLVDFWASWCRPCRAENPRLAATYEKYNSKGFTVYGVSLDDNKKPWEKAIKKDKLKWANVSDLAGWDSETRLTYNIWGLPSNILLDRTGKIIAKNLKGEKLNEKLKELLGDE